MSLHLIYNKLTKELIEVFTEELEIILSPRKATELIITRNTSSHYISVVNKGYTRYVYNCYNGQIDIHSILKEQWMEIPNTAAARLLYGPQR